MERKLRYSRQREQIYEYLASRHDHPAAEQIYGDLRPEIPGLSLGTVYRNLKLLEELGKIRRVVSVQGTERYDALCSDHAHFLCRKCGALLDLERIDDAAVRAAITLPEGCSLLKLDITATGICPNCAE